MACQPITLAKLPYDILHHLASLLSQRDLSHLSRTCRDLHDLLVPGLLRHPVVKYRLLGNFCRWLRLYNEDDGDRSLLRHLTVYNLKIDAHSAVFERTSGYLRKLLASSTSLTSLTLDGIAHVISPQQLHAALQTLPLLDHIALADITPQYEDIFVDAPCTPRSLSLSFLPSAVRHPRSSKERFVDPFPFLRHPSLQGIETLKIKSARLEAYPVVFPVLRRLEADSVWLRGWCAEALAGSFPRLQYLVLSSVYFPCSIMPDDAETVPLSEMRQSSNYVGRLRQRAELCRPELEHATWASLRVLRVGTASEWYALKVACPVSCVQLALPNVELCSDEVSQALADCRPRCLGVRLLASQMAQISGALAKSLKCSPWVTSLVLAVSVNHTSRVDFVSTFSSWGSSNLACTLTKDLRSVHQKTLGDSLNGASISHLLVQVHCSYIEAYGPIWSQTLYSAQLFIKGYDVPPVLRSFWIESYELGVLAGWTMDTGGNWKESSKESFAVVGAERLERIWV